MRHKKRKKASLRTIIAAVVVLCALLLLVMLASGGIFRIRSMIVVGNRRISSEEVIARTGLHIGDNYFSVSERELARRLEKDYYIDYISRDFNYNGTMTIRIYERHGMAVVQENGNHFVIDASGMILDEFGDTYPVDVEGPRVEGLQFTNHVSLMEGNLLPVADPGQLHAMEEVLRALDKTNLLSRSSRLNVRNIRDISVMISNATSVQLGDTSDLELKLLIAAGVLAKRETMTDPKLVGAKIDVANASRGVFIPPILETPTPVPTATPTIEPVPTP